MTLVPTSINDSVATRFASAIARGSGPASWYTGVALVAFYLLTSAANLTETDDVYEFAYRAENLPAREVSDPRLMLYHMLMRALYLVGHTLSPDMEALWIMRGFSALCAAALLLLTVRVLVNNFGIPPVMATLSALTLGCSYGFWRYAAEGEVYIPAMLVTLIVLQRLMVNALPIRDALTAGGLAGLAVLFYQPNVIPLLMAFPLLLVRRGQFDALLAYTTCCVLVTVAGYAAGYFLYWPDPPSLVSAKAFLAQRSSEFYVPVLSVKTVIVSVVRSAFAFGHDVIAATWLFGFAPAVDVIQRVFSSNVIHDDVYLASRSGGWRFVPLLVLPALFGVLAVAVFRSTASAWRGALYSMWTQPLLSTVVLWLSLQAVVIGRLNPAGIEAWIVVLLPASLLLGAVLMAKLQRCAQRRWAAIAVALLFTHNLTGGMAMTWDADSELDRARATWVLDNARSNDLVVVADASRFAKFLRYHLRADVALIRSNDAPALALAIRRGLQQVPVPVHHGNRPTRNGAELAARTLAAGGRVIVFSNFFREDPLPEPVGPLKPFYGSDLEYIEAFRQELESVWENPQVGSTFIYRSEPGTAPDG